MSAPTSAARGRCSSSTIWRQDPGELNNVAGRPEYRDVQQTLIGGDAGEDDRRFGLRPAAVTEAVPPAGQQKKAR